MKHTIDECKQFLVQCFSHPQYRRHLDLHYSDKRYINENKWSLDNDGSIPLFMEEYGVPDTIYVETFINNQFVSKHIPHSDVVSYKMFMYEDDDEVYSVLENSEGNLFLLNYGCN